MLSKIKDKTRNGNILRQYSWIFSRKTDKNRKIPQESEKNHAHPKRKEQNFITQQNCIGLFMNFYNGEVKRDMNFGFFSCRSAISKHNNQL